MCICVSYGLICFFLMVNDVEQISMSLFVICIFSLQRSVCPVLLPIIKIVFFVFLQVSFESCLYVLGTSTPLVLYYKYFFPINSLSFIYRNSVILLRPNLSFFFFTGQSFWSHIHEILPKDFLQFYSKLYTFTLISVILLSYFCIRCEGYVKIQFFTVGCPIVSMPIVGQIKPSLYNYLCTFLKGKLVIFMVLYSIQFI